jgi:hypothetical protein
MLNYLLKSHTWKDHYGIYFIEMHVHTYITLLELMLLNNFFFYHITVNIRDIKAKITRIKVIIKMMMTLIWLLIEVS